MTAPTNPPEAPLERLSALAARDFADPGEAIAAILDLARDLLGLTTALVTQSDGETWRAVHVSDAAFGLAPGATLPLPDTFCSLVGVNEPVVITDAPNDPRGGRVAAPARLGVRTFLGVPLVLRDGTVYGTLCALDKRASDLGGEAVAALRVLARLVVHELEHERHLAAVRNEEEERFRALVRHASDVITVLAADGTIRYESPAVERVLGYAADERVGGDPFARVHPNDLAQVRAIFAELLGDPGGSASAEFRFRHEDGSWRWLEAVATNRIADPELNGLVVNPRDVTERRRLEGALRLRDRAVAAATDGVFIADAARPDWPIIDVNPAFERITGYPAAEVLGRDCRFLEGPETDPAAAAAIGRALDEGRECAVTLLHYRKDGTPFWNGLRLAPVHDDAGRLTHFVGVLTDVTDRTRAEAALGEAEAKYRALVEQMPAVTYVTAREAPGTPWRVRYMSPQIAALLGYTPEEWAAEPGAWERALHPDDRTAVLAQDDPAVDDKAHRVDYRLIARDGRVVWIRDQVRLLGHEPGGALVAQGVAIDVTAHHEAEDRLQEAEAKYRALVENLPAVVYSERLLHDDPAAKPRYVSPQIADLLGYAQAEWLADPALWGSRLHPDDRDAVFAAYEAAERTGEPFRLEYRLLARDGRTVSVRDEAVQVRDEAGRPRFWQGFMLDVTDRRQAEARLREAEVRYRTLVESLPAIVYVQRVDGDGLTTTYMSPQVEAILGYAPEHYLNDRDEWAKRLHPDDRTRTLAEDVRTDVTGEPFRAEYRERARDGRWVWLRDEAVLVRGEDGRPAYWLGVQFDVTERKRAEEAVRASEERLRQALEAAQTATWDWDVPTGGLTWSSNVNAVFGLPVGTLGPSHLRFLDLVHPEDRARLGRVDDVIVAQGGGYAVEYRVVGRDGRVRWFADRGRTVRRDADGRPARVTGVTTDVTARKAAEEALRASEARFRALIQNGSDIVSVLAADGTIGYQSPAVEPVLGYAPGELEGRNVFAFIHSEDAQRSATALAACVAAPGGRAFVEHRFRHKDGSWRDLEAIGVNLLADPAVGGVVVNCRDVTERKAVEAAMRESGERSRKLATAARRQARELALLGEVRAVLARELELAPLFRTVVDAVAAAFGYAMVSLYLAEDDHLALQHQVGYPQVFDRISLDRGVMSRVARTGEPALVEDGGADPDFMRAFEGVGSEVCVPLRDGGRVIGVLNLESTDAMRLGEDDLRLMEALAEHIGVAIGRARLYAEVRAREERFGALVRNAPDLIMILAADGTLTYKSPSAEQALGYAPGENIGANALALVHPDDLAGVGDLFAEVLGNPGVNVPADFRVRHEDGSWRDLEALSINLLADPAVGGIVVNSRDVTERKRAEERLTHLAYHDPLTGLPNRAHFLERLDGALARARGGAGRVAVLLLDLDGFKLINDSRGHHAGDHLLAEVGRRLRGALRPGDTLARLGGDEFAALLEGVVAAGEGARAAERLIAALRAPVVLDGEEAYVGASVGVAASTRRRSQPDDLLRSADIALYRAKAAGPGSCAVFEPRMLAPFTERLERETALRRGLERGELELHYQPIVELATGRIVGAEALARWAHTEWGLLSPSAFIGLAEETGLIVPLGRWALREACRRAAGWQDGRPGPPLVVCVNVSARQLREAGFAAEVARTLEEGGLDPGRLELEITESVAMADAPETRRTVRALRQLGVRLAIDDFGTGYASLGGLRDLAVDALKVDGSFVAGLDGDATSLAIVRAVVVLAHALGLEVTAEGVETAEQAARLRGLGVELGQGFRFAPPLAAAAFDDLLARGSRLPEDLDVPDGGNAGIARGMPGAHDAESAAADRVGRGGEAPLAVPAGR